MGVHVDENFFQNFNPKTIVSDGDFKYNFKSQLLNVVSKIILKS